MSELNSTTENMNGGEETSVAESSTAEEKATMDAFESGFDDEAVGEGVQGESESESKSDVEDGVKNSTESQEEAGADEETKNSETETQERPGKRERSAKARIDELLAENRKKDAELAKYREEEAKRRVDIQPDEDGNYTLEQLREMNKLDTQEILDRKEAERLQEKTKYEQELASGEIDKIVGESRTKYDILNPKSPRYNAKIDALVADNVTRAIAPHAVGGIKDFTKMPAIVRETIDETMDAVEALATDARKGATQALDDLRSSSSIASANAGTNPTDDDPFAKGFDSVE